MPDYIGWYLVELERRLRRKRSARATTDLLTETSAHLEEHANELMHKGMDRVDAERAAVSDFGDPRFVANAVLGKTLLSKHWFWAVFALVVASGCSLAGSSILMIYAPTADRSVLLIAVSIPWVGLAAVAWQGFRTGRMISIPSALVVLFASAGVAMWTTNQIELFEIGGEQRFVNAHRRAEEISVRDSWLAQARSEFDRLQNWRANRNSPMADSMLREMSLSNGAYYSPIEWPIQVHRQLVKPFTSGSYPMWIYLDRPGKSLHLQGSNFSHAKRNWIQNGDAYARLLKNEIADVATERLALKNVAGSAWIERWNFVGKAPLIVGAGFAAMVLIVNGLFLILGNAFKRLRRNRWRKQLG
ncbi:MAG: permease prefix domain 1-containing protein [Fimbriimonadaceae bacterium]